MKKKKNESELLELSLKKHEKILLEYFSGKVFGGRISELATYADLFFKSPDPIFLIDPKEKIILECNPATMKCLNALEEEILGSSFYDWIFEKDYHDFERHLQNPIKMDFEMKTKSNEKIVMEFTTHSLKLQDYAEVIQIIAKDVTEVRKSRRALEEMNAVLARLSSVDEMTGLKNYRSFKEELQKIHEDSMKNMRPYSIVFIDVDHFKHYNDRNGHPAGDAVLRKVGELLKKSVRTQDLVARYGGEEFVAVLPNTVSEDAKKIAQNILDTIRAEKFPYGEFQPLGLVTASLGVASFPEHGTSSDLVLKAADEAVYFSKKSGRNRVSVYSELNPQKKAA